jgi:hypothetical protein
VGVFSEKDLLVGAALGHLIDATGSAVTIRAVGGSNVYIVEVYATKAVILFKFTAKKKSAWAFTVSSGELLALTQAEPSEPEARRFLGLICHTDGVCCVPLPVLVTVMRSGDAGGLSVKRRSRGSYLLSGPGRTEFERAIPQSDWPRAILGGKPL